MAGEKLTGNSREQQLIPLLLPPEKLGVLNEEEVYVYIRGPILAAENKAYSQERNTGLHKLVFLISEDISRVRDNFDRSIYKEPHEFAKDPEVTEAMSEAKNYANEVDKDPTRFYSEIADVVHNLTLLTVLDPQAEMLYKDREISYEDCIEVLAKSLNLKVRELLLLSAIKYTQRLKGKKDTQKEDDLIRKAISESTIPRPKLIQVNNACKALTIIGEDILLPRLIDLAEEKGWVLSTPSTEPNNIFK